VSESFLSRIAVVLVGVKAPGNLGAAARAMKNMGLEKLILVNPVAAIDGEAIAVAHGARDVLENARFFSSLAEALAPFSLRFGTTCRMGRKRGVAVTPRRMAQKVIPAHLPSSTAVVFGPEDRGLANEDLQLCHYLVEIPSSPAYRSLNLSHALMVVCYELFCSARSGAPKLIRLDPPTEDAGDHLHGSLRAAMRAAGFPTRGSADKVFMDICRILGRAEMSAREVSLMEGFFRKISGEL
jgi:TrmH family RNA methyltransferase